MFHLRRFLPPSANLAFFGTTTTSASPGTAAHAVAYAVLRSKHIHDHCTVPVLQYNTVNWQRHDEAKDAPEPCPWVHPAIHAWAKYIALALLLQRTAYAVTLRLAKLAGQQPAPPGVAP
jgi:hypothetical protein